MSYIQQLKMSHRYLWEKTVTHPFVLEMGEGTLPEQKFITYFAQDYVFIKDLVTMTALGISKAPSMEAASILSDFLAGIIDPENDLFVRTFKQLGVNEDEYSAVSASPATQAFGDFIVRVGLEGSFEDVATILYVTEGTYLDWGTRLLQNPKKLDNDVYQEWINLHGPNVLGDFVDWLDRYLAEIDLSKVIVRTEYLFLTALRYEYMFWQAAYKGQQWLEGE